MPSPDSLPGPWSPGVWVKRIHVGSPDPSAAWCCHPQMPAHLAWCSAATQFPEGMPHPALMPQKLEDQGIQSLWRHPLSRSTWLKCMDRQYCVRRDSTSRGSQQLNPPYPTPAPSQNSPAGSHQMGNHKGVGDRDRKGSLPREQPVHRCGCEKRERPEQRAP